ncbi:hypothetical protein EYF80_062219 [Liparis tanakae]|uniref:Uncharacterized protein n=1 Tax=Liparis tanakae TaxID=230148 RepID=A0A4Z2EGN0_9TELE|nr:hypothetical protein EYF80_062219 [Liparis tanakae]
MAAAAPPSPLRPRRSAPSLRPPLRPRRYVHRYTPVSTPPPLRPLAPPPRPAPHRAELVVVIVEVGAAALPRWPREGCWEL